MASSPKVSTISLALFSPHPLIKGEDKTEDITSYENNRNLINVKYKNNEKIYSYSKKNFQVYKNPTEIDIKNKKIILNQGYVYNVIKILKFESIYKLFFEDDTLAIVPEYSLKLVKNSEPQTLSINKFDYYFSRKIHIGLRF